MTRTKHFILTAVFILAAVHQSAALAAPDSLATQSDIGKMWKTGGITVERQVPVAGQRFKTAVAFTSPKQRKHSWEAQTGLNPKSPLRKGDALLASFSIRAAQPVGEAGFSVEGGPRFESSAMQTIKLTNKWQKVSVPFAAKGSYPAGKWQVCFKLGYAAQTVQIGDFHLVKR